MAKQEAEDNDLCRCCHNEGSFKNLYTSYSYLDDEVIYFNMLQECFDIEMTPVSQELQHMLCAICDACIERLQDAMKFKLQVQKCERRFRDVYRFCVNGEEANTDVKIKQEVDIEIEDVKDEAGMSLRTEMGSDHLSNVGTSKEPGKQQPISKTSKMAKQFDSLMNDDADDDDDFSDREELLSLLEENDVERRNASQTDKKTPEENSQDTDIAKGSKASLANERLTKRRTQVRVNVHYKELKDKIQCLQCPYTVGKSSLKYPINKMRAHVHVSHTSKYKCPVCSEQHKSLTAMITHKLEKHNIDERHECNACDKKFKTVILLKKHKECFHMLGEKMKCEECGFVAYLKRHLIRHKLVHSNVRKYKCKYCKKTFKRESTLRYHVRIHTGDKRQVCSECGAAFVQRASLKYHMNKHHPGIDF